MILRGAKRFLVVQYSGVSPPTSEAQVRHPAGAQRPCQAHGSEEKEERKETRTTTKKMNRQNPRSNGKSKPIQTKSHKEAYLYTLKKREKGKYIYNIKKKMKTATKPINESTNDNKQ